MTPDGKVGAALAQGRCPDCGGESFVFGPRGGLSINIECAGCRARFNVSVWRGQLAFAQRIPSEKDGGGDWWVADLPHVQRQPGSLLQFIHAPPNDGGQMRELFAFLSVDEGGEGLCAALMQDLGAVQLVTGKAKNAEAMKRMALEVAKASGKRVRLVRFVAAETLWTTDQ